MTRLAVRRMARDLGVWGLCVIAGCAFWAALALLLGVAR